MCPQNIGEVGQTNPFGLGRSRKREQRVQIALEVFEVRFGQSFQSFAQLSASHSVVHGIEQRQRQDRQPGLREQAKSFGNDVAAVRERFDLETVAMTVGENGELMIGDAEQLAKQSGDLITASRLRQYY